MDVLKRAIDKLENERAYNRTRSMLEKAFGPLLIERKDDLFQARPDNVIITTNMPFGQREAIPCFGTGETESAALFDLNNQLTNPSGIYIRADHLVFNAKTKSWAAGTVRHVTFNKQPPIPESERTGILITAFQLYTARTCHDRQFDNHVFETLCQQFEGLTLRSSSGKMWEITSKVETIEALNSKMIPTGAVIGRGTTQVEAKVDFMKKLMDPNGIKCNGQHLKFCRSPAYWRPNL